MPPRFIRTPPRLLSADIAAAARRKNLNDAFRDLDETSSGMADAQSYGGLPPSDKGIFVRTPKKVLTPRQSAAAYREVLNQAIGDFPGGISPLNRDAEKAKRLAERDVRDHVSDVQYGVPLMPMGVVRDAVRDFGTPAAGRLAQRTLWGSLVEDPTYTRKFGNTYTGSDPTVRVEPLVSTAPSVQDQRFIPSMGVGENVATTKTTPFRLLRRMVGSDSRAKEIATRLHERNAPGGMDGAAIFHLDNLDRSLTEPWLIHRSMDNSFDEQVPEARQGGFADPISKQIFLNRSRDPYAVRNMDGEFNVGQHEFIHSILDSMPASRPFRMMSDASFPYTARPAVADVASPLRPDDPAAYLGGNSSEMANLLFHLKRQTEITNPDWPDIGATRQSSGGWLDSVRGWKPTGSDPIITLPGHMHEGQPAHGYEQAMEWLQRIIETRGKEGYRDLEDLNFKTGQTRSLKEALLT